MEPAFRVVHSMIYRNYALTVEELRSEIRSFGARRMMVLISEVFRDMEKVGCYSIRYNKVLCDRLFDDRSRLQIQGMYKKSIKMPIVFSPAQLFFLLQLCCEELGSASDTIDEVSQVEYVSDDKVRLRKIFLGANDLISNYEEMEADSGGRMLSLSKVMRDYYLYNSHNVQLTLIRNYKLFIKYFADRTLCNCDHYTDLQKEFENKFGIAWKGFFLAGVVCYFNFNKLKSGGYLDLAKLELEIDGHGLTVVREFLRMTSIDARERNVYGEAALMNSVEYSVKRSLIMVNERTIIPTSLDYFVSSFSNPYWWIVDKTEKSERQGVSQFFGEIYHMHYAKDVQERGNIDEVEKCYFEEEINEFDSSDAVFWGHDAMIFVEIKSAVPKLKDTLIDSSKDAEEDDLNKMIYKGLAQLSDNIGRYFEGKYFRAPSRNSVIPVLILKEGFPLLPGLRKELIEDIVCSDSRLRWINDSRVNAVQVASFEELDQMLNVCEESGISIGRLWEEKAHSESAKKSVKEFLKNSYSLELPASQREILKEALVNAKGYFFAPPERP